MLYVSQWSILIIVCLPLLALSLIVVVPIAVLLWLTGVVDKSRDAAAQRDQVLAHVLQKAGGNGAVQGHMAAGTRRWVLNLASLSRIYTSLVTLALHNILCIFVHLGRPQTVFVVYLPNTHLMSKFFCIGVAELVYQWGLLPGSMRPAEQPWVFNLGLIHAGPDVGFGAYGIVLPALHQLTQRHLEQLPAALEQQFPAARSIAMAGRLPGLMAEAGVPIKAPLVDGLSGTVFAMESAIQALLDKLPPERQAHPTVAVLGGGGYIGARLVSVLAVQNQAQHTSGRYWSSPINAGQPHNQPSRFSNPAGELEAQSKPLPQAEQCAPRPAQPLGLADSDDLQLTVSPAASLFKQVIALDTRYKGARTEQWGVLHTAEPRDLETADVVLVITRSGADVAEYVEHAQPGQVWGDDTHPEISQAVLTQLAARGVSVHKAMARRSPPTLLLPRLPGWPVTGTPGCLLMALVSAATNTDWNGAGTGLSARQSAAAGQQDAYWAFAEATRSLGFHAMLTQHRRSKINQHAEADR